MRISPLRQRTIDDMTARHFGEKTQQCLPRCEARTKPNADDGEF